MWFDKFLPYISAAAVLVSMIASGVTAIAALKLENRLYKFKEDLLEVLSGKFIHADVASEKFARLNEKLEDLKAKVAGR